MKLFGVINVILPSSIEEILRHEDDISNLLTRNRLPCSVLIFPVVWSQHHHWKELPCVVEPSMSLDCSKPIGMGEVIKGKFKIAIVARTSVHYYRI